MENDFRDEFTFVDYRRWGILETWSAGRVNGPPPKRSRAQDRITVYFNYDVVGRYTSYQEAQKQIDALLLQAPVKLDDLVHYLRLRR